MKTQTINTFSFNELSEKVENKRLELCNKFYNILENEHYFFYSDENIKEMILYNDYEFLEDGNIF